jgi:hypothetical protein
VASTSILDSTKKTLGIDAAYHAFDDDIIMHINSVFVTLAQLGIGPMNGFQIESEVETWDLFIGVDKLLNSVKTYVYLRVRLLFDPPATSYLIESLNQQRQEMEWRLTAYQDGLSWVDPEPSPVLIVDGGGV